jgi:hypothetical protein
MIAQLICVQLVRAEGMARTGPERIQTYVSTGSGAMTHGSGEINANEEVKP